MHNPKVDFQLTRHVARVCGVILAVLLTLNTALFIHRPAAWADEVSDTTESQMIDGETGATDTTDGGDTANPDAAVDPSDTPSTQSTDENPQNGSDSSQQAGDTPATQSDDDGTTSELAGDSTTVAKSTRTSTITIGDTLKITDVASITFANSIDVPADATYTWNAADDGSAGVTAWAVPNASNTSTYDVTYASDGVYPSFPEDSSYLFYKMSNLTAVNNLNMVDTASTTNMMNMFYNCSSLTSLDVSNFNTSNVTNMRNMFYNCNKLTSLDVSNFDTSNATDMLSMFQDCSSLTSLDVSHFDTSKVTRMGSMFRGCSSLTSLDVSHFDTANADGMSYMFYNCQKLTSLDVSHFDTANTVGMSYMFYNCQKLTSLDVSHFDTANVRDMAYMFYGCYLLPSLDVSHFNTAKVRDMHAMFSQCRKLPSLDVSHFDTANVTNMASMFSSCYLLPSLDLSHFNTAKVTNMSYMFANCKTLTELDLSSFNTANVTNMSYMFSTCETLTSVDVTSFNTAKVTDMSYMFQFCYRLTTLDVSQFNTANVKNMASMFYSCTRLPVLDVSKFDTSKVTNMPYMFRACNALTALDLSSFNTAKVSNMARMFDSMTRLNRLTLGTQFSFNGSKTSRQNTGLSAPYSPDKTGYTAAKKWMNETTGTVYDSPTDIPNGDSLEPAGASSATYVPYYIPHTYTVHFETGADDATGTMDDQAFTYDEEQTLTKNTFERTGYTFAGWQDADGNIYTDEQAVKNLSATDGDTITLTAQWKANEYAITYDLDGGTNDPANPDHYTYGEGVDSFNDPTREGFTFTGWRDDDGNIIDHISPTDIGNKHLTAQWGVTNLPKTGSTITPLTLTYAGLILALLAGLAFAGIALTNRRHA